MTSYMLRRLAGMVVVMFIVASIVFVIAHVIPGDPAAVMLGSDATAADVAALRARMGLDAPLVLQYLRFLIAAAHLDLGESIFLNRSVVAALAERAPLTLQLTVLAAALAIGIGVPVGVISAVKRGSVLDQAVTALSMTAASLPSFWIGLTLIEYLAVRLGILPVAGYGPPDADMLERLRFLILPAIAVGVPNSALIIRFTRTGMLDVLQEDYVRTARAKGLSPRMVIVKHAFRNARTSVLTVIGITVAGLLGGAIVTETVFALPGVGNLIVSAVLRRDYPVIQGALLVISGVYVLVNLGVDLLYAVLDPRVRY
ncbi:MAG TPA: ABC transporter permease [Acetobacteraceae bacterium]|jgi:peptide/nickel transport system permease protein|nr:ABC transporter permease [Acetobacteraceae bacterium]